MSEKVSIREIKSIRGRLKSELRDGNLTFHRRVEVESLIYHLDTWIDWKEGHDKKRYMDAITKRKLNKGG